MYEMDDGIDPEHHSNINWSCEYNTDKQET